MRGGMARKFMGGRGGMRGGGVSRGGMAMRGGMRGGMVRGGFQGTPARGAFAMRGGARAAVVRTAPVPALPPSTGLGDTPPPPPVRQASPPVKQPPPPTTEEPQKEKKSFFDRFRKKDPQPEPEPPQRKLKTFLRLKPKYKISLFIVLHFNTYMVIVLIIGRKDFFSFFLIAECTQIAIFLVEVCIKCRQSRLLLSSFPKLD